MIKYQVVNWSNDVKKIEISRETEKSVYINNTRQAKKSEWAVFFDSFQEAKEYLVKKNKDKIELLERSLSRTRSDLEKILKKGSNNV